MRVSKKGQKRKKRGVEWWYPMREGCQSRAARGVALTRFYLVENGKRQPMLHALGFYDAWRVDVPCGEFPGRVSNE